MLKHDFQSDVGYWVHKCAHRFESHMNSMLVDKGISYRQMQILAWLCLGNILWCGFAAMRQRNLKLRRWWGPRRLVRMSLTLTRSACRVPRLRVSVWSRVWITLMTSTAMV